MAGPAFNGPRAAEGNRVVETDEEVHPAGGRRRIAVQHQRRDCRAAALERLTDAGRPVGLDKDVVLDQRDELTGGQPDPAANPVATVGSAGTVTTSTRWKPSKAERSDLRSPIGQRDDHHLDTGAHRLRPQMGDGACQLIEPPRHREDRRQQRPGSLDRVHRCIVAELDLRGFKGICLAPPEPLLELKAPSVCAAVNARIGDRSYREVIAGPEASWLETDSTTMSFIVRFFVASVVLLSALPASADTLGIASGYNVFVFGNMTLSNTDVEGRAAVGGNATFSSFGVGQSVAANAGQLNLVVGGNAGLTNGQIFNGSGRAASSTLTGVGLNTPGATFTNGPSPVDFAAADVALTGLLRQPPGARNHGLVRVAALG